MFETSSFIFYIISLVIAITIHEFAHAFVADYLGDPTPRLQGRVTLNPLAHLDPLGSLLLFIAHFGWGKPVQFDPFNLRNPRRDAALISLAGPGINLVAAIICSVLLHLLLLIVNPSLPKIVPAAELEIGNLLAALITTNCVLAVFNLIPIHPLDGFKIVGGWLNPEQAREWYSLERYGIIFLIFLLFPFFGSTAPISHLLDPVLRFLFNLLLPGRIGVI